MSFIIDRKIGAGVELWLLRCALFVSALLYAAGLFDFKNSAAELGLLDLSTKWQMGFTGLTLLAGGLFFLAFISLSRIGIIFLNRVQVLGKLFQSFRKINWLIFLSCTFLFSFITLGPFSSLTDHIFTRAFLLWFFSLIGYGCLSALWPQRTWPFRLLASILVITVFYRVGTYLPGITNYPFSLGWGESSNINNASLFVANKLFGAPAPLPMINSGRALLSALPFLLPAPQIWISRLWAAVLWVSMTAVTAYLLNRRLGHTDRLVTFLMTLFAFLYILQGPIYYELLIQVALVLWLFDTRRFGRSLLVVVAASLWAGICRVNWFPMPGVTAAFLYFLEVPIGVQGWWRYLWKPAAWAGGGLAAALASFIVYSAIAGNETTFAFSSMNSPLLWYRLLPSATDSWGVLATALVVALPGLILIGMWWKKQGKDWNFWRKLGIIAILPVFFGGGIVVSVKIGGGAGIHNLDAFWFLLLLLGSFLYFKRTPADKAAAVEGFRVPSFLTAFLVAIPVLMQLTNVNAQPLPDQQRVDYVIGNMRAYIYPVVEKGKPVLFIDNKQLITFGYFPPVRMAPEYETVFMLEMAMSGNEKFFEKFRQDLKDNRFGAIVTYPQPDRLQGPGQSFFEENNVQIKYIGQTLICYYQVVRSWSDVSVAIFLPRPQPQDCP